MADTQKIAYKLAATIGGVGVASGVPFGAATGEVDVGAYRTGGISGQQSTISPGVTAVTDTYSKVEVDAKLALSAEKAGRATDGIASQLSLVLAGLADLKADVSSVKNDNKNTRLTIVITVVGATLAALGALWTTQGSMVTAMGNHLSSFQAGLSIAGAAQPPPPVSAPPVKK